MPSKHALLSASSSERWLHCTPCARLEERFPNTTSVYAEEGTKAHSLCEIKLYNLLARKPLEAVYDSAEDVYEIDGQKYPYEMYHYTDVYADYVTEELNAAKAQTEDARLLIEVQLDFQEYVPDGFGTSDAVIVSDKTLEVIDFKYGKGVPVDAKGNSQLRLYALGAYLALSDVYDFDTVKTLVIQPRIDNITSETLSVTELLEWADNFVKPRAKLAFSGEGEYCVGDHCRFCRAAGVCRARVTDAFSILDKAEQLPPVLNDEEIPAILAKLDGAEKWIESIRKYALEKALTGVTWEGYKLVEARTIRKIEDPISALDRLKKLGYSQEDVTNVKLKGLTDLEKLLGKTGFKETLGDLVVKPKGAPTLVKESDKRQAINPIANAFKEEIDNG